LVDLGPFGAAFEEREGAWRNGLLSEEWPGHAALVEQLGLVEQAGALGYGTR
jgi:hypothetical protein